MHHEFFRAIAMLAVGAGAWFSTIDGALSAEGGKRYVIIHADDAGMSHSVNRGTIEGLERGIVSSASIMVPCPWFPEFAAYARQHPEHDYGIHLTLNSEWTYYRWGPVAPREKVPSLIDDQGYLWDNVPQVAEHARAEEVEIELRAQIERAKKFGVPLSHLDTHMGAVVSRPDLVKVYVKLGTEYDLPVLFIRPTAENNVAKQYPGVEVMARVLDEHKLPMLDALFQFYEHGSYEARKKKYLDTLRNLKPGVSQIIIHCGVDGPELRAITSSVDIRDTDRRVFTDPEVIDEVKRMGVEVISWKQFRAMKDKAAGSEK